MKYELELLREENRLLIAKCEELTKLDALGQINSTLNLILFALESVTTNVNTCNDSCIRVDIDGPRR